MRRLFEHCCVELDLTSALSLNHIARILQLLKESLIIVLVLPLNDFHSELIENVQPRLEMYADEVFSKYPVIIMEHVCMKHCARDASYCGCYCCCYCC